MNKLEQLEKQLAELGREIETLKNKPTKIDWSKMPKDTLVETRLPGDSWRKRYFAHTQDEGYGCFYCGDKSETSTTVYTWPEIRLIENKPQPWFGGECPIPDGVRFRYWLRSSTGRDDYYERCDATNASWGWTGFRPNSHEEIIAYQILGEDQ